MKMRMKIEAFAGILVAFLFLPDIAAAQSSGEDAKTTRMLDSFGRTPNGDVKGRLDMFFYELDKEPKSTGLIINHGDSAQIAARKRLIQNQIVFRRFDASRISFRSGANVGDFRTDMWLIPENGTQPEIKPEAWIAETFLRVSKAVAEMKISRFFALQLSKTDHQGYIINYGTPAQIKQREKWIVNLISFRRFDRARITLVNGGKGPVRTVMWLVPPGVKNPDV